MSARLERLDRLIADSEQSITEQVLRVMVLEAEGKPTTTARRLLRNIQDIHVETLRARRAIAEALEAGNAAAGAEPQVHRNRA